MDFRSLPKIELHLHLEGALSRNFLFKLNQQVSPALTPDEFEKKNSFSNFNDFIRLWCYHQSLFFRNGDVPASINAMVADFFEYLEHENIRYAEVHISPIDSLYFTHGFPEMLSRGSFFEELIKQYDFAVDFYSAQRGREVFLIVDLVRNYGPAVARFQTDILLKTRNQWRRIFGVGLGGGRGERSITDVGPFFAELANGGYELFAHAGELPPQDLATFEVNEALNLGVCRIGHGLHCHGDRATRARILENGVALEICPTSNLLTGSVSTLADHPLAKLVKAGVSVVIGSDDPTYFHTTLTREYEILPLLGLNSASIEQIYRQSIAMARRISPPLRREFSSIPSRFFL